MHNNPSSRRSRSSLFVRAYETSRALRTTGRLLYLVLAALIIASAAGLLLMLNNAFLVSVPLYGASLSEGIVGSPRFINPVLASTEADADLAALVYSGLLKDSPSGGYAPALASSYDISPDGRTYTVHLRPNAMFQDGTPVTASDVAFTVAEVLDPAIKSPERAGWEGVTVSTPDARTVVFTLPAPYAPFLGNLTLGILPKHLWQGVSEAQFPFSSLNTSPIGSGPYRVVGIEKTPAGVATSYELSAFSGYALGTPYISSFTLRFYANEDDLVSALANGSVDAGAGISPASLARLPGATVVSAPLDRVFGVFFDQNNNPALAAPEVRQALNMATDRSALINSVLAGHAAPLSGPLPPALAGDSENATSTAADLAGAKALLARDGWSAGPDGVLQKITTSGKKSQLERLAFTLSTSNVPELSAVAQSLAENWRKLGASVTVQVYQEGDLEQNVIRPRKYDALLFGEVVGGPADLFAFWNSTQRNDPGLNIALYANASIDTILDGLRNATSTYATQPLLAQFQNDLSKDDPAVFLYSPDFIYVVPSDLKGVALGDVTQPSDRFADVEAWYRDTDRVWSIFAKKYY